MSERLLVTAALPYANGSIHLGHLVEYCQTDMYVRAQKRLGVDALYICADDTHGTPIEVNAHKQGITPEELVARYHAEHERDFARYDVAFDHFSMTHSDANRRIVEDVYATLRARGLLEDREMDAIWCEKDQRFLPDRFIRGTCPSCGAADQYGDVCEVCGATYSPAEVKHPRCALCGTPPVTKRTEHVFFKLSDPQITAFLRGWIDSGTLQPDVANYVRKWVEGGLRDWCISRDGPYFGFGIPDRPGKYFYVWLDAPFGYTASSAEWAATHGVPLDELWKSPKTRIEHIIGKDIVYFHTLFWPAVLHATGYSLPAKVHVHGMLTIDGEKMSKSRGTFINASTFAQHVEPQAFRYYLASKASPSTDDVDLSLDDFVFRVNSELVNKHANLFSRVAQFVANKLDGRLGELPFTAAATHELPTGDGSLVDLARRVTQACRRVEEAYAKRDLADAVRELVVISEIGNEVMQARAPWDQLKTNAEAARETCTFAANVCYALAVYLWPIVPRFAEACARVLDIELGRFDATKLWALRNHRLGKMERLFDRIERKTMDAIVEASRQLAPKPAAPASPAVTSDGATSATVDAAASAGKHQGILAPPARPPIPAATGPAAPLKANVAYERFAELDLRVGTVLSAERVPKSKKLLRLEVDLNEGKPRQILAGIGQRYAPEGIVGTQVVVVANLAPAQIMGLTSEGMVLAGGEADSLAVLRLDQPLPPGTTVR